MKNTQKRIKFRDDDNDKFDGLKAVGCLVFGIILLAIFVSAASYFISQIRQTNEKTRTENALP